MKTALVIMAPASAPALAAASSSWPLSALNGEIIMDYSIHDAIEAGFDKIVFIIRHDIEEAFKEAIGNRIEKTCADLGVEIAYAFQEKDAIPPGTKFPLSAASPGAPARQFWPARMSSRSRSPLSMLTTTMARKLLSRFTTSCRATPPDKPNALSMAGFVLKNTLSDNGAVTRGVLPDERRRLPDRCRGDFRH